MRELDKNAPLSVCLIGAQSTIAQAIAEDLRRLNAAVSLTGIQRSAVSEDSAFGSVWVTDYSESSLAQLTQTLKQDNQRFDLIISCLGLLHQGELQPERSLQDLSLEALETLFHVNTFLPALCLKYFSPLLKPNQESVFCFLSAKLASISDTQLGGWYTYRASKAALNMLIKTASIEIKRKAPQSIIVTVHPGTTTSPLSAPFTQRRSAELIYTPAQTARRILTLIEQHKPQDSGQFFNWDGQALPW